MTFRSDESPHVVVYQYVYWDPEKQEMVRSDRYALASTIRSGLGIVLTQTGQKVPRRLVDEYGRLKDVDGHDSPPLDLVFVWHFRAWSASHNEMRVSTRPATLEAIEAARGEALEETRRAVPRSLIDRDGFLAAESV